MNKGKNKEGSGVDQPILEETLEAELPDPAFSLNDRGQSGQERTMYGMPQLIGESSGKGEPTRIDKPSPYRPPLMATRERESRWRKPDTRNEANSGNDRGPRWDLRPHTPPNNAANQQIRDELAELRRMVVRNAQPQPHPLFRIAYQKPYPEFIDEQNPFPLNFKMPAFPTFSGEDNNVSSRDHIFKFSNH